jgi:quercetin dioxygenase-like cupin family protein
MKAVKQDEKDWIKKEGYSKKILFTEYGLGSKGNVVQIVKIPAKSEVKAHYHKQTKEIFYILKGNGMMFFGDKQTRPKDGDVFLCEPSDVHGVVNDSDEDLIILVFKIDAKENDSYWIEE